MTKPTYFAPRGGSPAQTDLLTGRAVFTQAYAVIPKGVMMDIVTSYLPHWTDTRAWIIARPMTGFAETFAQYVVEVFPGGGSDRPEPEAGVEGVLLVVEGNATVTIEGKPHQLKPGGYAFLPPGCSWSFANKGTVPVRFHWVRKRYEKVDGIDVPVPVEMHEHYENKLNGTTVEGHATYSNFRQFKVNVDEDIAPIKDDDKQER